MRYVKTSVGIKDGAVAGKTAVKWFAQKVMGLDAELAVIEEQIDQKCQEMEKTHFPGFLQRWETLRGLMMLNYTGFYKNIKERKRSKRQ